MKKVAIISLLLIHAPVSYALSWRSVISAPVRAARSVGKWCRSHPEDALLLGLVGVYMLASMAKNYRNRIPGIMPPDRRDPNLGHPAIRVAHRDGGVQVHVNHNLLPPGGIQAVPRPAGISDDQWRIVQQLHNNVDVENLLAPLFAMVNQLRMRAAVENAQQPQPIDENAVRILQDRLRNRQEASTNAQNDECTICLENLGDRCVVTRCNIQDGEPLGRHGFHSDCLARAFRVANNTSCPNCRSEYCVELAPLAPQYIPGRVG